MTQAFFAEQYTAISTWVVERGRIEVGRSQDAGFVVRALDDAGLIFEDDQPRTFAEALAALEKGLAERFKEEEIKLK